MNAHDVQAMPPPALKAFIDAVIVPALLDRFLREQGVTVPPVRPAA